MQLTVLVFRENLRPETRFRTPGSGAFKITLLYISSALALLLAGFVLTLKHRRAEHVFFAAGLSALSALNGLTAAFEPNAPAAISSFKFGLSALLPVLLFLHLRSLLRPPFRLNLSLAGHALVPLAAIGALSGLVDRDTFLFVVWMLFALLGLREAWVSQRSRDARQKSAILLWAWIVPVWCMTVAVADLTIARWIEAASAQGIAMILMSAGALSLTSVAAVLFASLHRSELLEWLLNRPRVRVARPPDLIERLEAELLKNRMYLDPNITLERFSRKLGQPQRVVADEINETRGCSFRVWLNSFRIAEAKRLLTVSPNLPITEIMFDAGFQTKSTFNAAFKAETGLSPSAWRRQGRPKQA